MNLIKELEDVLKLPTFMGTRDTVGVNLAVNMILNRIDDLGLEIVDKKQDTGHEGALDSEVDISKAVQSVMPKVRGYHSIAVATYSIVTGQDRIKTIREILKNDCHLYTVISVSDMVLYTDHCKVKFCNVNEPKSFEGLSVDAAFNFPNDIANVICKTSICSLLSDSEIITYINMIERGVL